MLLPIRDAAGTLDGCLASLVRQDLADWECLAVDDHSVDGSTEIARAWAIRDPRIRFVEAPAPGGIVAALETGRRLARGRLIARQDADDESRPARFARQVASLERDESLAVVGCLTDTPGGVTRGMQRYLDWLARCIAPEDCGREIWIESPIAHPTAMMRASALLEVGGYRESGWPEDYDLWLRLHRAGWNLANVPEVLYEWNDRPDRLSRRDPRYAPEAFRRCRVHHLQRWLAARGVDRPLVIWGAGRDGKRFVRAWEESGEGAVVAAFVDIDPRKIGRRRRGRPILDPVAARDTFPGAFYLAAVGVPGAREQIRRALGEWGAVEGDDFLCVH